MPVYHVREMRDRPAILQDAITAAGGLSTLAKSLALSPSTICEWSQIPAGRVIAVERVTGIPRQQLRPDIYPAD
jgi:DNA-binding transcriptional regulator YdaS (Cro superfamily)